MNEIWKDIAGYEQLYQVSNIGRVKSLERKVKWKNGYRIVSEKIIKQIKDKDGYLKVNLNKGGIKKNIRVHRLVCYAFIPNQENFTEVNHKDECKTNNNVENLEWCTREYNNSYGTRKQRFCKKVICIETGKIYTSTREIKRQFGFNNSSISQCCNGKRYKTVGGFHWKYVD